MRFRLGLLSSMTLYPAPHAPPKVVEGARDPPGRPYSFPVPSRPPANASGAGFFSFFSGNTTKESPEKAVSPQSCLVRPTCLVLVCAERVLHFYMQWVCTLVFLSAGPISELQYRRTARWSRRRSLRRGAAATAALAALLLVARASGRASRAVRRM